MNWELLQYLKAFNAVFFSKTSKLVGFILRLKSLYWSIQVWLVTSILETLSCPSVSYCKICPNTNRLWSRESKIAGYQNSTLFTVLVRTCFLLRKKRLSFYSLFILIVCVSVGPKHGVCAVLSTVVIFLQGQCFSSVPSKKWWMRKSGLLKVLSSLFDLLLKFQQGKVTDFLNAYWSCDVVHNDSVPLGRHFLSCMIVNYLVVLQKLLYCSPLVWTASQSA